MNESEEALHMRWQKRIARQIGYVFLSISVLLIIIALGIKGQADKIHPYFDFGGPVSHALMNIAWLFAILGIVGFFVAGLAYLFSLPVPARRKQSKVIVSEDREDSEAKKQ